MNGENYSLSWNDFSTSTTNAFKLLLTEKNFTDVTLVCEDDKQIDAHKLILSSSSSFFQNILLRNHHPNPMIYLKGIKYKELEGIIKFIYLGQTEVGQDDLTEFITVAKDLEINGLKENIDKASNTGQMKSRIQDDDAHEKIYQSSVDKDTAAYPLENEIALADNILREETGEEFFGQIDVFDTEESKQLNEHAGFVCEECFKNFTSAGNLKQHKTAIHQGKRYPCNQCDYEGTRSTSLKRHIASRHSLV